ncbi:MAG: ferritin-like domain-containing protein [candidate division WOR-3 bacterium]
MLSKLAELLRTLQLYTHIAHNYVKGPLFLQDHDFLGDLYKEYESDYDDLVERIIGLGKPCNLKELHKMSIASLELLPTEVKENKEYFVQILALERKLNDFANEVCKKDPSISEGTKQLVGDIANKSEKRMYKLKQRIG